MKDYVYGFYQLSGESRFQYVLFFFIHNRFVNTVYARFQSKLYECAEVGTFQKIPHEKQERNRAAELPSCCPTAAAFPQFNI